jgi:hypothetical protein
MLELIRRAHALPCGGRLRSVPAEISDRRRGKWNSFERCDAVVDCAAQFPARDLCGVESRVRGGRGQ